MGRTIKSHYYRGNKISEDGIQNGYVDYGTLAKSFDAVLCNDITKLFYSSINNEYVEPEQVNGFIDNSEMIEFKQNQIEELETTLEKLLDIDPDERSTEELSHILYLQSEIETIQEQIEELEQEQEEPPEIYQYYIISSSGADILQYDTNEIVYYIEHLDMYIWGVTHCGTSWDYVLTDIKIETEE